MGADSTFHEANPTIKREVSKTLIVDAMLETL